MYHKIFKYKDRLVFVHHVFVRAVDFSYIKLDGSLGRTITLSNVEMIEFHRKFKPVLDIKYKVVVDLTKHRAQRNNKAKILYIQDKKK